MLADCLHHARSLGATHVVDLATLTGAIVVALGDLHTGMFGRDDEFVERIRAAGELGGEHVWRMPLHDTYKRFMRSDVADMMNALDRRQGRRLLRRPLPAGVRRRGAVGAPRHRRGRRPRRPTAATGSARAAPAGACGCWWSSPSRCAELRPLRRAPPLPRHGQGVRRGRDRAAGGAARPRGPLPARAGRPRRPSSGSWASRSRPNGRAPAPTRWRTRSRSRSSPASTSRSRSRSRRTRRSGTQPINLFGTRRAEAPLAAAARVGPAAGRVRPDRAGRGLRRRRDPHDGAARGRRVGGRRREDVHHERRHRDLGARDRSPPAPAPTRSRTS